MTTRIATVFLLGALALTPGLAVAEEHESLEQLVVEMAKTPAEHAALASHYRAEAAKAQAGVREHEAMARSYMPSGQSKISWGTIKQRQKMADHCKRLSQASESMAKEYDALAKLHDEEAKQAQ